MSKKRRATKTARGPVKARGRARLTAVKLVANKKKSVRERTTALAALSPASADEAQLKALMAVLVDRDAPTQLRYDALRNLGAAEFASTAFAASRAEYIAALRKIVDDPDLELRQRVLGILAREKDAYAQKRLLEGLQRPEKALLPPEKALLLLSYDAHADAYPVARAILKNPPNPLAKREALRLLAADSASAPTFEQILRDKNEPTEIRQLGASALHALKPDSLQAHAREILMDPSEGDDMHQTSLTALTQFGAPAMSRDQHLMDRVEQLTTRGSGALQKSARQFRTKYKR